LKALVHRAEAQQIDDVRAIVLHMTIKTYIRETRWGEKIEYRRRWNPVAIILESRILRPDGTPFPGDAWYRVADADFVAMLFRPNSRSVVPIDDARYFIDFPCECQL
jgi:hypothetical protein